MSEIPEPAPTGDEEPSKGQKLLKGCGCVTGVLVMALGILIIGGFDTAAWASALTATIVAVLVFTMSGINGNWER